MIRGMRHVFSSTALTAVVLLSAAPAFAQLPPWAQQQRRLNGEPQQRPQQHPQQQPQRAPQPPQHQARPAQPAPQPQARPIQQPSAVEAATSAPQQVQQKPKPEPVAVAPNTQDRTACLNKETPQAALIAACTAIIEAARGGASVLAPAYFNRGDAYRAKGEIDNAIADFDNAIKL